MIISKTPLRVSFFGGGSDLKEYYQHGRGAVLSASINKYLYVMVNKKFDPYIRIGYGETEIVHDVNDIKHNIIRECIKLVGGFTEGLDVVYMADVQPYNFGTGLGVSSSIAVGVLNALYTFKGIQVRQEQLAEEACHIEIDVLKEPIGKQDQYAVAHGGINKIEFLADESVNVTPQAFSEDVIAQLEDQLYLVHTGMTSDSHKVLSEQKQNYSQKRLVVDSMVAMVDDNLNHLQNGDITHLGQSLHATWQKKQSLATLISNSQINDIYQSGLSAGALGGKVLGSGGGGFILFFVPQLSRSAFLKSMAGYRTLKVGFENRGSHIVFNDS